MTRQDRPPWPMRWIVVAIVAILVPYTLITLLYRKPNKPFSPYGDLKDRAQVSRLLDAGFGRNRGTVARAPIFPSPGVSPMAAYERTAGGVPPALAAALLDPPVPAQRLGALAAPGEIDAHQPWSLVVEASIDSTTPPRAELYRRERDVTLLLQPPDSVNAASVAAAQLIPWRIEFPPGLLPAGSYRVVVPGQQAGLVWSLTVRLNETGGAPGTMNITHPKG